MATASSQVFNGEKSTNVVNRTEIQTAIAKAVELRALHAALMKGSSPADNPRNQSPVSRTLPPLSAYDYPVFTPSYGDEPVPAYNQIPPRSRKISESWDDYGLEVEEAINGASRTGFLTDDQKSVTGSVNDHITALQASPGSEFYRPISRRNSLGDFKSISSSCNRRNKPGADSETTIIRSMKHSNIVVPLTDSHSSLQPQPKNRGVISWLFPKLKRKHKAAAAAAAIDHSPNRTDQSEEVSQMLFKDLGVSSIEALKRELMEANENRDAALREVAEMRSSLGDLNDKLGYLETYCEQLKKALKQATQAKESTLHEKLATLHQNSMPVSEEVMVEGFMQIVSEARLSVKHFCKTLISQVEETDHTLVDCLNSLLQPYKLALFSKYSKAVLYHVEAFVNETLYQDFENCVFQKNGSPKVLDPNQDRQEQFSSFVALRNLSWNEVLRKGTKYYSEEFSKFCDQKMSLIITTLGWTRPWPEHLLQAFFVAAKCIWLLHLLAFSFSPPLSILRVDQNRGFDPQFMEDMFSDRQRTQGPTKVKIMVMPGFYVQNRVLKCKVLCRSLLIQLGVREVKFSPRETNRVTDQLSKHARTSTEDFIYFDRVLDFLK